MAERSLVEDIIMKVLESQGFRIERNVEVRGLSGFTHRYPMKAVKGILEILIDVASSRLELFLLFFKAIDVRGYAPVIVVNESTFSGVALPRESLPRNVLLFRDIADLKEKLEKLLTS